MGKCAGKQLLVVYYQRQQYGQRMDRQYDNGNVNNDNKDNNNYVFKKTRREGYPDNHHQGDRQIHRQDKRKTAGNENYKNKGGKDMLRKIIMFMVVMIFAGSAAYAAPADLPATGQTTCYDTSGNAIACGSTGQDGDIKAGVAWTSPRFTVGTGAESACVTDNLTGLMWVKSPDSTTRQWANALTYANTLTLCGYDDWRLPNVNELESMVNAEQADSAAWLNTQGFSNVHAGNYWSSTTVAGATAYKWLVDMGYGGVHYNSKYNDYYGWPVRAGQ